MSPSSGATTDVISIVIPTYNRVEYLRRCIHALCEHTEVAYQLYIADDCSPSKGLQKYLDELESSEQATVLRPKAHRGFPGIINWAVKQVPGDICLLDADTEPMPRWLAYMQQELQADPEVGIIGALLVYPETKGKPLGGTIQHAGVDRTGRGYPYHPLRGKSPSHKEASVRRELDAVTGACILIRRKVWKDLKGFDEGFEGGQFEDVDFCWRARKAGWKIVYQPKAVLCHLENGLGPESAGQGGLNLQRLMSRWPKLRGDESLFQGKDGIPEALEALEELPEELEEFKELEVLEKPEDPEESSADVPGEPRDVNIPKHLLQPQHLFLIREDLERWPLRVKPGLVTIIIVTHNTLKITADCIRSILDKTVCPFELIVVDNDSKDGSVGWLKKQSYLTLIANKHNTGWSSANNQGIWRSRGEYCLLLNSDTVARTRGWLREMVRLARPDDVATVGAKLLYPDGKIQHIGGSIHDGNPFHPYDGASADIKASLKPRDIPFATGACLLIKKSTLRLVGLIDEGYPFGYGDVDYGLRCLEAGLRNVYCPLAALTHLWAYTQRKTGKWIPPKSLARFRQLWPRKKIATLAPVSLMDFMWPTCANWIRATGPGSHIVAIRDAKMEKGMTWGGIN